MPWLVRGDDVLAATEVAVTRRLRARGLIGREDLEAILVLRPCRQVHTFGMRFPIDVVYADREGRVLKLVRAIRPWRASYCVGAKTALELPVGAIDRVGVEVGDHLVIEHT